MLKKNDIDFVLSWVDGDDPNWQKEIEKYSVIDGSDNRIRRYRNWDNLNYWFRGVEVFAPWVKNVYLVTWGHIPDWLNIDHPKIRIVKHEDYIPEEYLPTFSSRAIGLNLHRIPGLSENFVYFNDDTFILREVKESDFFKNNLPCDSAILNAFYFTNKDGKTIGFIPPVYNTSIINKHFSKNKSIMKNITKWITPIYGFHWFRTILLLPWDKFTGFMNYHLPNSFKKETFNIVWQLEYDTLSRTCSHKFRHCEDVNDWLIVYWQLASGKFFPRNPGIGRAYHLTSKNEDICNEVYSAITKQKFKFICVNDNLDDNSFPFVKKKIKECFEKILPQKCSYEK